jgi:hypothetical protein
MPTSIKILMTYNFRPCLEQRRSLVPFVVSTDGLIGGDSDQNLLKQIVLRLTAKWEQPNSVVRGFGKARINQRYCEQPIFASEVPKSQWLDVAGLGLFEIM